MSARLSRRAFLGAAMTSVLACRKTSAEEARTQRQLYRPAEAAVDKGLAFLAESQVRDGPLAGSFGGALNAGNIAITSLAGLAFLSGGHVPGADRHGGVVERAVGLILRYADAGGCLREPEPRWPMYSHGFGMLFLAETLGMLATTSANRTLRGVLSRGVKLLVATQNEEGGWRYQPEIAPEADLSVTVVQAMALRAAQAADIDVPRQTLDRCLAYIQACQLLPEGAFRYSPRSATLTWPLTAAGLVGLHCCGIYRGNEVDAARRYLQGFRLDRKPASSVPVEHFFYGHYYAAQAMRHVGGSAWLDWYTIIRDALCPVAGGRSGEGWRPRPSGAWEDAKHGDCYATAMACIILQLPLSLLPIHRA